MLGSLRGSAVFVSAVLLVMTISSPVLAEKPVEKSRTITGAELQRAMYEALVAIEKARGMDSKVSDGFYWYNEDLQNAFEAVEDKQRFLTALTAIKHRSLGARIGDRNKKVMAPPPSTSTKTLNGTPPVTPNYPDPNLDVDYAWLWVLGLAPDLYERCDGEAYAYYQSVLYGASVTLRAAQMACTVAGCDPTGVLCVSVCGATEIVAAGWELLNEPILYCDHWGAKLDAAENEAAFKNSESILLDLDAHDDRILSALAQQAGAVDDLAAALAAHDLLVNGKLNGLDASLDTHDARLVQHDGHLSTHDAALAKHDADIKAILAQMYATLVANQKEIIKLLKTPEGKRPGWGKEGY